MWKCLSSRFNKSQEARAATTAARGCDAAWRGEVNITLASPMPSSRSAAASPAAGLSLTLSAHLKFRCVVSKNSKFQDLTCYTPGKLQRRM